MAGGPGEQEHPRHLPPGQQMQMGFPCQDRGAGTVRAELDAHVAQDGAGLLQAGLRGGAQRTLRAALPPPARQGWVKTICRSSGVFGDKMQAAGNCLQPRTLLLAPFPPPHLCYYGSRNGPFSPVS